MKTLIFVLLLSSIAHADWFCTEESSKVMHGEIDACGVAYNLTEDESRANALELAVREFHSICENSVGCRYAEYTAIPTRTECKYDKYAYKCYRMVRFVLNK